MTQYNTLNVKLFNSQSNELKSGIKNCTQVTLNLPSNIIGDDDTNFAHKLSLSNTQVLKIRTKFSNVSVVSIKFFKNSTF